MGRAVQENCTLGQLACEDQGRGQAVGRFLCGARLFGLSLTIFLPGIVLVVYYDLVHYEEQLVWECFAWLCGFALAQIVAAFLTAPSLGWGMIKESSWDKDLGVVLRGSMNQQGVVSTLLFLTIMSKLQVNLKGFDLTNNVGNLSSFDIIAAADPNAADYTFAEYALAQWYALSYMHTILNAEMLIIGFMRSQVPRLNRPCGRAISPGHHHHHHLQDPHRAPQ